MATTIAQTVRISFLKVLVWLSLNPIALATWYEATSNNRLFRADSESAVGFFNNSAYIIGGRDFPSQVTKYDATTNTLTDLGENALTTPLHGGYGQFWTQQDSILYVIMGEDNPTTLATYNMATEQLTTNWKELQTSVNIYGCLASSPQYLYIIGGYNGATISTMQILSLSTFQWLTNPQPPSMNEARGGHACIVKNHYLWAFGGIIGTDQSVQSVHRTNERIYTINIAQNTWEYVEQTFPLKYLRVVARNDDIYIMGGDSAKIGSSLQDDVYIMNANDGTVNELLDFMPFSNQLFAAVIIESVPGLFIFGGMRSLFDGGATNEWAYYTFSSVSPTNIPSRVSTLNPSGFPSIAPTRGFTMDPTSAPIPEPTLSPINVSISTTPPDDEQSTIANITSMSSVVWQTENVSVPSTRSYTINTVIALCISVAVCCIICIVFVCKWSQKRKNMYSINRNMVSGANKISHEANGKQNVVRQSIDEKPKVDNLEDDELRLWFEDYVKLPQYYSCFMEHGYDHLSSLKNIKDKSELQAIGIQLMGHRTRIWAEIQMIKNEPGSDPVAKEIDVTSDEMMDATDINTEKQTNGDEVVVGNLLKEGQQQNQEEGVNATLVSVEDVHDFINEELYDNNGNDVVTDAGCMTTTGGAPPN